MNDSPPSLTSTFYTTPYIHASGIVCLSSMNMHSGAGQFSYSIWEERARSAAMGYELVAPRVVVYLLAMLVRGGGICVVAPFMGIVRGLCAWNGSTCLCMLSGYLLRLLGSA